MGLYNRIYSDYFLPDRMPVYEELLSAALKAGYQHISVLEFHRLVSASGLKDSAKYFIHRHDIDSDVKTARRFFELEKKHGIRSSFYFRLCTIDIPLMKEIQAYGSEACYHYEELAQFCKDKGIKSEEGVMRNMETIRKEFTTNFRNLEKELGYKMLTAASHGDFVNRKLGIPNHRLMNDVLKKELGLEAEGYDHLLLNNYGCIMADEGYPRYFKPQNPFDAIRQGIKTVYLLTHPRQWKARPWLNTKDNLQRLWEGIKYSMA